MVVGARMKTADKITGGISHDFGWRGELCDFSFINDENLVRQRKGFLWIVRDNKGC